MFYACLSNATDNLQVELQGSTLSQSVLIILVIITVLQTTVVLLVVIFLVCKYRRGTSGNTARSAAPKGDVEGVLDEEQDELYEMVEPEEKKPPRGQGRREALPKKGNPYTK